MEVKPKLDWMWLGGQHVTFRNIGLQLRSTTPLIWFSTLLTNMKMFSTRWPPPLGLCKINVDGALFPTKKLDGIGVVIRDQQDRLLAALCKKIRAQLGVLEVEAKAYEASVLLARQLGLNDGVLEGDSLTVSNALKRVS